MITFYHAPQSRSSAILTLVEEMGIRDRLDIRLVDIPRVMTGTGAPDPANPHPERKVPCLVDDGRIITERGAIMTYLTTRFPGPLAPALDSPDWGRFLTWMTWYQGVMEPVLICQAAGISHPYLTAAIRGEAEVTARVRAALDPDLGGGPWLLGDQFTAADLLIHSPYGWFNNTPDDALIRDWAARVANRPARLRVLEEDAARMKVMSAA